MKKYLFTFLLFFISTSLSFSQTYSNYGKRKQEELKRAREASEFSNKQRKLALEKKERDNLALEKIYKIKEDVLNKIRENKKNLSETNYKEVIESEKNYWELFYVFLKNSNSPFEVYNEYYSILMMYKENTLNTLYNKMN
ncbi:hypothetical protein [Empedobacter sp. GD03797]|uniref:hypothetical protein n=1 Tax=Empedobacter sp. GD03797 TaxID=2975382 RepID=UPI00244D419B|nr:hypothetical protein [Empedobacter sp. GD03797]MDH1882658.1 hypothetical protein [Empedobacter sp. GD03797]